MAKLGRRFKPYQTSEGATIDGLARDRDGRWRIVATHQRFTEPDEAKAVDRFRAWEREQKKAARSETVAVPLQGEWHEFEAVPPLKVNIGEGGAMSFEQLVSAQPFWDLVRKLLLDETKMVAERTGLPGLVSFRHESLPKPSLKFAKLRETYQTFADVTPNTKRRVLKAFDDFVAGVAAGSVDELTVEGIIKYREAVKSRTDINSNDHIATLFDRAKRVVAYGLEHGLDQAQIRKALDMLKMLKAPKSNTKNDPKPIDISDWHKLMDAEPADEMKAVLLCGLNLCMYLSEVLSLRWDEIDLEKKTFVSRRNKTKVIRVGVLWDETVEAIRKMPRAGQSPWIFTSNRGGAYNVNSYRGKFATYRNKAKVAIEFNQLRDGAYTVACQFSEEKYSKLLAGHSYSGLTDAYVARNPAFVKPATDAIYRHYMSNGINYL